MQRFVVILTLVLFAANTIISAAWAKPCAASDTAPVQAEAASDMPCHGEQQKAPEEKSPAKHCDGLCLCLHAALSQNLIMEEFDTAFFAPAAAMHDFAALPGAHSLSIPPPKRPPRQA